MSSLKTTDFRDERPGTIALHSTTYLAVYVGPGGPISVTFESDNLDDARDCITEYGAEWFDEGLDYLDLPEGAASEDVEREIAERGWRMVAPAAGLRSPEPTRSARVGVIPYSIYTA